MKRILAALAILAAMTPVIAAPISITEGNPDSLGIYSIEGERISPSQIGNSFIIVSDGDYAFSSESFEVRLKDDTAVAVALSETPSVYLIQGYADIELRESSAFEAYTPTSRADIDSAGRYILASTEESESFMNLSSAYIFIYDSIFGRTITVEPGTVLDLIDDSVRGASALPYEIGGISGEFLISDGYAAVTYPEGAISESDVRGFLRYAGGKYQGLSYSYEPDLLLLYYPESITAENAEAMVPELLADIGNYIASLAAPAVEAPIPAKEEAPSAAESVPVKEESPAAIARSLYGRTIRFWISDGKTAILYPAEVTEKDAELFLAYEAEKYPELASAVRYSFIDGGVLLTYPQTISAADAEASIDTFVNDIVEYIASLPAIYERSIYGRTIRFEISDGKTAILYPAEVTEKDAELFLAYEAEKYPELASAVRYSFIDGGVLLTYPQTISAADAAASIDTLIGDIKEFIALAYAPVPSAPALSVSSVEIEEPSPADAPSAGASEAPAAPVSGEAASEPSGEASYLPPGPASYRDDDGFDLILSGSAYADSAGNTLFTPKLIFTFGYPGFDLGLSIDPLHIGLGMKALLDDPASDAYDWTAWATDFIEYLRFYGNSYSFSLDRTYLYGDTLGLYSGIDHGWDEEYSALSFNHEFISAYYSHRIWFDDLSFRRDDVYSTAGLSFSFSFSDSYPLSLTLEAVGRINREDITQSSLYPEIALFIPFYFNGGDYVGIAGGAATLLRNDWGANPFTENGILGTGMFVMSFGDVYLEAGAGYSSGDIHYGGVSHEMYAPLSGEYVTILGAFSYDGPKTGFGVRGWFDLDASTFAIVNENTFIEAYAYLNIYRSFSLFGGLQSAYDTDGLETWFYAGFEAQAGPVATYFKTMLKDGVWSFTLAGSVSLLGPYESNALDYSRQKAGVTFDTAMRYSFESNSVVFDVMPAIRIGSDDLSASFRAPLQIAFDNNGRIYLEGFNGHALYDFGATAMEEVRIWQIYSDAVSIIDSINLGRERETAAYLIAARDGYMKDGTLFSGFSSSDALALRAGLTFPVLDIELFVDDLSAPHIGDFAFSITPAGKDSVAIRIGIPTEFLQYQLSGGIAEMYPELRVDVPFLEDFSISAFVAGAARAEFDNSGNISSFFIYDNASGTFGPWLAGGEFAYRSGIFDIAIEAGYRSGSISNIMFNDFTAMRKEPSLTAADNGVFAGITLATRVEPFYLSISYAADDLATLFTSPESLVYDDLLAIRLGFVFDNADIYASFSRRHFVRSFYEDMSFADYMICPDTLFSIGTEVDFNSFIFYAELGLDFIEDDSVFCNIPTVWSESLQLKIGTRLEF